ncbi:hypothetical protein [Aliikangiella maris]|uniref:Uncharacterized protein n=2 Tax=Aliikangiella maris TaxID=3162458 RepID=A0ABV3MTL6_9GAMM
MLDTLANKLMIKGSFYGLCLLIYSTSPCADDMEYTTVLTYKTKYLAKIGATVDTNVFQPYFEAKSKSGFYSSLWLNIPLEHGNPNKSIEVEPSIGYISHFEGWTLNTSLTLFDIENPDTLDFDGDMIGSKIRVENSMMYFEVLHYTADDNNNGLLSEIGTELKFFEKEKIFVNLSYVDGPLHFKPIIFSKVKLVRPIDNSNFSFSLELLNVIDKKSSQDVRKDGVSLGISYAF